MDDFIANSDEEESEEVRSCSTGSDDDGPSPRDDPSAEWLGDAASLDKELARELEQRGAETSCKTAFVLKLLERLHSEGHRTLIFSQSKVMLSILEVRLARICCAEPCLAGDLVLGCR
jgi:SNF2 family DNA or RNA helicase